MKAAVIGLGVEGKKATKSLLNNEWDVYASDLATNIDLEELEISNFDYNYSTNQKNLNISCENLNVDLGYNNQDIIANCDAVVLSPSLWNTKLAKEVIISDKLISDVLTNHKNTFVIGITGTNGKTTTCLMLKEILENAGKKVLIGGNAGGGFNGYCDLILESEKDFYDVIIVEVCDMTLAFCDYTFDFDVIGLTNIANDHMNVHGSLENYKNSVLEFSKNKTVFLDENLSCLEEFKTFKEKTDMSKRNCYHINISTFSEFRDELKLFGRFNRLNAGLATSIAKYLDIDSGIIQNTLKNFEAIEGRLKTFKLNDSTIFIGKTDNSHAVKSLLDEKDFYAIFIGTPRFNEEHRLDILNEVAKSNPEVIVLFPGLDDTIDHGLYRLNSIGYDGRIEVVNDLNSIIKLLAEYSHEDAIFIGGNGQETIIKIQERLKLLSDSCEDRDVC